MDLDPNPLPCLVADMLGLVARAGTSAEMQMQHSKHALHSTLDIRLDTLTQTQLAWQVPEIGWSTATL
jgi:hypothetical protein